MSPWLSLDLPLLGLFGFAVALAWIRLARMTLPVRRRWMLVLLQPLCALALYGVLHPPPRPGHAGTLVIATAHADPARVAAAQAVAVIALPEAPLLPGAQHQPDLASALRAHPGAQRLHVVGDGLVARDRDSARGWPLTFAPTPAPLGVIALSPPPPTAPGARFQLHGRVRGSGNARIELLDPAGEVIDHATPGANGHFALEGHARSAGTAVFSVRLRGNDDAAGTVLELPVPVVVPPKLSLLVLAGAPQPELKYLRRWAVDAGLELHTEIAVGHGLQLGDAPLALTSSALQRFDLVIIDERALAALSRSERATLRKAIATGLGVLVRLSGPLSPRQRTAMAELGLAVEDGGRLLPLAAAHSDDEAKHVGNNSPAAPALHRWNAHPAAGAHLHVLSGDAGGAAWSWWRALGRGRIGVSTLADSYRLALAGDSAAHGQHWAGQVAMLARATAQAAPPLSATPAWTEQRVTLCGLLGEASVVAPDGRRQTLLSARNANADDTAAAGRCAGYWPEQPGWHVLVNGNRQLGFLVRDPTQAQALYREQLRAGTLALVNTAQLSGDHHAKPLPGSRWPWWWLFLALAGLTWWLERRRQTPMPASG